MLAIGSVVCASRQGGSGGVRTSQTSGLGGFCGPGGSVVEGRCNRGSREATGEEGPPLEGEVWSMVVEEGRFKSPPHFVRGDPL